MSYYHYGKGATISLTGNEKYDDYHFAYVGKYGRLTLNDVTIKKFNTALYVAGNVYANSITFCEM